MEFGELFSSYVPSVLTFEDPEDLHQMRISARKLLACMDLVADKKERSRPEFMVIRNFVKGYMRPLGRLRDLDVLIDELRQRSSVAGPEQASLLAAWLTDSLKEREETRQLAMVLLPGLASLEFSGRLEIWQERLGRVTQASPKGRIKKLRKNANEALEGIRDYPGCPVDNEDFLTQSHHARIRVKKLRYALTITGDDQKEIEACKAIQDALGRVQDMRVWISRLERYREDYPGAVETMISSLRSETTGLLRTVPLMVKAC